MNLERKHKPIVFSGEVKDTVVCINTNVELDNPHAILRCVGEAQGCALRLLSNNACEIKVQIGEDIAQLGAGHYELALFDDCDECDTIPVQINDDCYITSVTHKRATTMRKCGGEC